MGNQVDLNKLRETIQENRQKGELAPLKPSQQVVVHEGRIKPGSELAPGEERQAAVIHQATFAALSERHSRDQQVVNLKMPRGTRFIEVGGVGGWLFKIVNEFGKPFEMFTYFDGSLYQTKVVSPEVEGKYSPHNGHLFDDGRICYGDSAGQSDLEGAYGKSVLWANGFTVFQRTGSFPF